MPCSISDTFIYEYVGEVLDHKTFMKRMQAYAEEGIRHFYFMMLQREEVSGVRSARAGCMHSAHTAFRCSISTQRKRAAKRAS